MYCYTQVNNLVCVFNELELWSSISSEHPIFIKTVGGLTNKNLPPNIIDKLLYINKIFTDLENQTLTFKKSMVPNPQMHYQYIKQLRTLVDVFLKNDEYVFTVLPEVKQYGLEDKTWQALLEHITHEQRFMYNLFTDLRDQLGT